jgi:hypothetical protein
MEPRVVSTLEDLLRACPMVCGTIQLYRSPDERWTARVAHDNSYMAWRDGNDHGDPVDALRAALIEDRRLHSDLERRYAQAMAAADPLQSMFG